MVRLGYFSWTLALCVQKYVYTVQGEEAGSEGFVYRTNSLFDLRERELVGGT